MDCRAFTLAACLFALSAPTVNAGPLEPSAALADFELPDGFRIELVACEPQVVDPVAIAFDEDGRLWVIEMRDYPTLAAGEAPKSRIRVLEDRDGDGQYEAGVTFAEGLMFPTGVQPWRGGVIVTLAGEIAYFPDEDRDGRADRKETWYEGFAKDNEQLRANHPQLAADGLVYVAGGLRGGTIRNLRRPGSPDVSINGRDFAFDPLTGECQAVSGNGQFGLTFDDFGRRFTCSNRNPLVQVMIDQRYLDRNPTLVLPSVVHDVAAAGDASRLYPRSRAMTTSALHTGQFTAACGVEIFRGDALPSHAYGDAFVCEPTANLVHREALLWNGAGMTAASAEKEKEFLSATDEWFRPVNLCTGPDGALYLVDMYRAVIEHPAWMPEEWRDRPDMRDGDDRGRIYRIVAEGTGERRSEDRAIRDRDPRALVALLAHPNSWQRETAARLLLETSGAGAVAEELQRMVIAAKEPVARFHALAALQSARSQHAWEGEAPAEPPAGKSGSAGASPSRKLVARTKIILDETLLAALDDDAAEIRELALALAEKRILNSPRLAAKVLSMANDTDARVRFQVALTLMALPAEATVPALTLIADQSGADEWTRRAVALSSRKQAAKVLAAMVSHDAGLNDGGVNVARLRELIDAVIATGDLQELAGLLAHSQSLSAHAAHDVVVEVASALEQRGRSFAEPLSILADLHPAAYAGVQELFADAMAILINQTLTDRERVAAGRLLRFDAGGDAIEPLLTMLETEPSPAVQIAAIGALRWRTDERIPQALLAAFSGQMPSVRQATLDVLASRQDWTRALLDAVAAGQVAAADVDASRAQALKQHPDAALRALAGGVLGSHSTDREDVVRHYDAALRLKGDAGRGRLVFRTNCASCHRVGEEGLAVGPDIGDAAMKPAAQLLTDILDPNRAIDANYVSYMALTLSGLAHQGIIASETDRGIVLRTAEGKTVTILRDELDTLSGGGSLMPEGIERQVSVEQMADLLAFLKMWRQEISRDRAVAK
jgi:putative membrane-bound dehydrogenase-like protein